MMMKDHKVQEIFSLNLTPHMVDSMVRAGFVDWTGQYEFVERSLDFSPVAAERKTRSNIPLLPPLTREDGRWEISGI